MNKPIDRQTMADHLADCAAEREAARKELREIRKAITALRGESTLDEVERVVREVKRQAWLKDIESGKAKLFEQRWHSAQIGLNSAEANNARLAAELERAERKYNQLWSEWHGSIPHTVALLEANDKVEEWELMYRSAEADIDRFISQAEQEKMRGDTYRRRALAIGKRARMLRNQASTIVVVRRVNLDHQRLQARAAAAERELERVRGAVENVATEIERSAGVNSAPYADMVRAALARQDTHGTGAPAQEGDA